MVERGWIYLQTDRDLCGTGEIAHESSNKNTHTILPSPAPLRRSTKQYPSPPVGSSCLVPDPTEGKRGNLSAEKFPTSFAGGAGTWVSSWVSSRHVAKLCHIGFIPSFSGQGRWIYPSGASQHPRSMSSCYIKVVLLSKISIFPETFRGSITVLCKQTNIDILWSRRQSHH